MLLGRAVVEEVKQSTGERNFLLRPSWNEQGQHNLHRKLATWVIMYPCEYGLGYHTHDHGQGCGLDFSMRILKDLGLCLQGAHRLSSPPLPSCLACLDVSQCSVDGLVSCHPGRRQCSSLGRGRNLEKCWSGCRQSRLQQSPGSALSCRTRSWCYLGGRMEESLCPRKQGMSRGRGGSMTSSCKVCKLRNGPTLQDDVLMHTSLCEG